MSADRDAVLLSGQDFDTIVDATDEAESAICALLHELHAEASGAVTIDRVAALDALMRLNTATRMTMKTVNAAARTKGSESDG